MTGSDHDDAEWPIGSDDAERPASREEDRALRFGGEHERHVRYEDARMANRQIRNEPSQEVVAPATNRRGINPVLLALGGLVLLLLLAWLFVGKGDPDQDKLTGSQSAQNAPSPAAAASDKFCGSRTVYDLIKRDLFRRAAQLRGGDAAAYDQVSNSAVLRMERPVLVSETKDGLIRCSGFLSLDLPPGVAVVGGRRTFSADVDYDVVLQTADGTGPTLLLRNANAIITPLATLSRLAEAPAAAPEGPPIEATPVTAPETPQPPSPPSTAPSARPAEQSVPAKPSSTARPSFNCGYARTNGEIAVCGNAGLAALDRQMTAQYRGAIAGASPEQQAILQQTRDRFLGYRDRCPNTSCIGDAYVGRMREIRDIMEGRWEPPR